MVTTTEGDYDCITVVSLHIISSSKAFLLKEEGNIIHVKIDEEKTLARKNQLNTDFYVFIVLITSLTLTSSMFLVYLKLNWPNLEFL